MGSIKEINVKNQTYYYHIILDYYLIINISYYFLMIWLISKILTQTH